VIRSEIQHHGDAASYVFADSAKACTRPGGLVDPLLAAWISEGRPGL
jgi:hypothetical protein